MNFDKYINTVPFIAPYKDAEEYKKYRAEYDRLNELFKSDLFDDLDISDNPKREDLFSIAWDYGHSSGYSEVYGYALDLVRLIK